MVVLQRRPSDDAFSAECALFPFFLGIVDEKKMVEATVNYIEDQKLNKPFPLIYTQDERPSDTTGG